ncbi:Pre-mRNA-processing factor 39 [Colletotrichum orbiculare MAFF 240422]|uniref:Pre-mRNA-processing factor 39 n=1 Tax=Colletotrichum orbiculare (strain 104-T / ATCC 96160 / CBS 514.97 / LARS 414 / MAFF 240422) TaxID=1213857 RepID=N4UQY2_COLOR|nr:Pre-mRNA-processing factor 39 [Colletotrichum orbiculare MAFF 240422]
MSDFDNFGSSEEENAEIQKLQAEVDADPDNFESWEKLVRACEGLEGGLNRNSSPQALATLRKAYDRFLLKFPLLFGYWKKYADLEFNIAGPESAEMVYERGCASITNSVDLWTDYCSFKMETTHVPHLVRELFERGATCVGLDFLAHPFWDKYIEYEERQEAQDKIFAILARVIHIPMHQYARYFERFRQLSHSRPVTELVPTETLDRFKSEVEAESAQYAGAPRTDLEIERDIRTKIDAMYYEYFTQTQNETNKRWTYESEVKRPYFHVTELENAQLANWRKYLDFEESEGDYTRIVFLYERCLVTCAFYDEFWFRYARWMSAQEDKEEEVRIIYQRAATLYVPISRPGIRLQYAYYEESRGRIDVARDIHAAILMKLPDCIEAITSWAHLQRRQSGLDAAVEVFKAQIDSPQVDIFTKAALVTEWSNFLWKVKGSTEEARNVFLKNVQWYADSRVFWDRWLDFELQQTTNEEVEGEHGERVKQIFDSLKSKSRLSVSTKRELYHIYLSYLQQRGGKDAMKQFLAVDREIFGPNSVSALKSAVVGDKENGAGAGELDEATKHRAEARYLRYYELPNEPDVEGQGTALFN